MVMSLAPYFWNNATQRVLSQSNNLNYAVRGVFRVNDTQDNRKGDYWFRDFGMVMACTYMTEFGFRSVEKLYTIPMITKALDLHALDKQTHAIDSKKLLYKAPRQYNELPAIVRSKLMGSLIRNSSDLVPKLMKDYEVRALKEMDANHPDMAGLDAKAIEALKTDTRELLKTPSENGLKIVQDYLGQHGLASHEEAIRSISGIENEARREAALKGFLGKNASLDGNAVKRAIRLEDTRQMGILIDHLHRTLNFKEYLKENYLNKNTKLSDCVNDLMSSHWDRLQDLHEKGKKELPDLLSELRDLPLARRVEVLNKKIEPYRNLLYFKNGVKLVKADSIQQFEDLVGKHIPEALKAEGAEGKEKLKKLLPQIDHFYTSLASPANQAHTLTQFWETMVPELKKKISSKIEGVVDDVRKLSPDKNRHEALDKKFKDLAFPDNHPGLQKKLEALLATLKQDSHLPNEGGKTVTSDCRDNIKDAIKHFIDNELPNDRKVLLDPFVRYIPKPEEFKRMIADGMKSKHVVDVINKTQKNGTWPKMFITVLLNLVFYGWMASNFDNKILQPYQKKLVAERGTSQDIVTAGYLGLIPGAAILTQLVDKTTLPIIRKLGYFNRFAVVGGAALAAFGGSTYFILQELVKRPPTIKSASPIAANPTYRPGMGLGSAYPAANAFRPASSPLAPGMTASSPFQRPMMPGFPPAAGLGQSQGAGFSRFGNKNPELN